MIPTFRLSPRDEQMPGVPQTLVQASVEKLFHKAEATVHCAMNKTIHADATGADLYAAIDCLADKLDRQVKKHKEKIQNHHREVVREARYAS